MVAYWEIYILHFHFQQAQDNSTDLSSISDHFSLITNLTLLNHFISSHFPGLKYNGDTLTQLLVLFSTIM
jgi:hypothetical protein